MTGTASIVAGSDQSAAQLRPGASAGVLPPWMTGTASGRSRGLQHGRKPPERRPAPPRCPIGVLPPWMTGMASGGSTASSVAGSDQSAAQLRPGASAEVLPPWMTGKASGRSHGLQRGRKRPECRPASPWCPAGVLLPPWMTGTASGDPRPPSMAGSGQRAAPLRPGASAGVLPPWMTGTASSMTGSGQSAAQLRPGASAEVLPPWMTGTASKRSHSLQHGQQTPRAPPSFALVLRRGTAAALDDRHGLRGLRDRQHGRKPHGAAPVSRRGCYRPE